MSERTPSRLRARFDALRRANRKALVVYLTACDPDLERSVALAEACLAAGADVLEWGVPFSDPTADGPVLQAAALRALAGGATLERVLEGVRQLRARRDDPVVLFGYVNPLLARGLGEAARAAAEAGVDGALVVDCPPEEAERIGLQTALDGAGLDAVHLVTPLSHAGRLELAAPRSRGFVYAVSLVGITGTALAGLDGVRATVARVRAHTDLPVCVGFGIREPAQAAEVAAACDGAVVGSHLVELAAREREAGNTHWIEAVAARVAELRAAIDGATAEAPAPEGAR